MKSSRAEVETMTVQKFQLYEPIYMRTCEKPV